MQLNLQTRFPEFKSQGLWTLRLCVCGDASGLEGGDSTLEELFAGFLQMKPVPAALPRKLSPLISPNADTGRLRSLLLAVFPILTRCNLALTKNR